MSAGKWRLARVMAMAMLAAAACGMGRGPSTRQRLRHACAYTCYYGTDRHADLAKFDLVIVEARQHRAEDLAALRARGTIVLGYVSVGQADQLEPGDGRGPGGAASWYLDGVTATDRGWQPGPDGKPDQDAQWHSYYVDASSKAWQRRLNSEVRRVLESCDGVFLDTLLYPSEYDDTMRRTLERGVVGWIGRVRKAHPTAVIVANNGWAYLQGIGRAVDGVMYEDFTTRYQPINGPQREESDRVAQELIAFRGAQWRWPLVVLALDYIKPEDGAMIRQARERAERYGFLHSFSSGNVEGHELYVLSTVNPANRLEALRRGGEVALRWDADRLSCREAGVESFVLKRASRPIRALHRTRSAPTIWHCCKRRSKRRWRHSSRASACA